jgi:hypothetical protein
LEKDWFKLHINYLLKNLDAYYLAIDAFFEFPEIKEYEVKHLINQEFGYERFSKNTFMQHVLVTQAKDKYLALAQNYASEK